MRSLVLIVAAAAGISILAPIAVCPCSTRYYDAARKTPTGCPCCAKEAPEATPRSCCHEESSVPACPLNVSQPVIDRENKCQCVEKGTPPVPEVLGTAGDASARKIVPQHYAFSCETTALPGSMPDHAVDRISVHDPPGSTFLLHCALLC